MLFYQPSVSICLWVSPSQKEVLWKASEHTEETPRPEGEVKRCFQWDLIRRVPEDLLASPGDTPPFVIPSPCLHP